MGATGGTDDARDGSAPAEAAGEITLALQDLRAGKAGADERLMRLVHGHLRRIAGGYLRREQAGHALDPTDLLHEAYLRLFGPDPPALEDRRHLYGAFARAVRQVLVDHARERDAAKRGGDWVRVTLTGDIAPAAQRAVDVLELHEALERLAALGERRARIVELRFFGGLSIPEIAETLAVSSATVDREWALAKAWLQAELSA